MYYQCAIIIATAHRNTVHYNLASSGAVDTAVCSIELEVDDLKIERAIGHLEAAGGDANLSVYAWSSMQ